MPDGVDPALVRIWAAAWARSRGVSPPVEAWGGFRILVGEAEQKERYVFPTLDPSRFRALSEAITEPWIFLKVCAPASRVLELLPERWRIVEPRYMMASPLHDAGDGVSLPQGYDLDVHEEAWGLRAEIADPLGACAARGGLLIEDGKAVFDRIETAEAHRRKGLARALMLKLQEEAVSRGANEGVLVATEAGRALYSSLGWRLLSEYTSAVIPG